MTDPRLVEQYAFRDAVLRELEADLLGPSEPDETIGDPPITRYLTGVLYPQSTEPLDPAEETDDPEDYGETSTPDPAVSLANLRYPSSMGITFAVDPRLTQALAVQVTCARYEQVDQTEPHDTGAPSRSRRTNQADAQPWHRFAIDERLSVPIATKAFEDRIPVAPGLELFCRTRPSRDDGSVAVTFVVINTNKATKGSTAKDALSFFQASIKVSSASEARGAFVERSAPGTSADDPDLRSYALLYRHAGIYAVGHGCSATWSIGDEGPEFIASTFVPTFELRLMVSNPAIDLPTLALDFLSKGDRQQVLHELERLPEAYLQWIALRRGDHVPSPLSGVAADHLRACDSAAARMRLGIELLRTDDTAWNAFRLANRAMLIVRSRADWHRRGRPDGGPTEDGSQAWYPFQLGFILMCLPGVADATAEDRSIVDLLWFPTGGGKTEAYFGLVAFDVFLRRLKLAGDGAGVTALMRYTLRLLTIQQFERAAALICACESIRRGDASLASGPAISLGLWVGGDGTPNTRRQAELSLKKVRAGIELEKGNPVQLRSCPWCGEALDGRNYFLNPDKSQLVVACRRSSCPFAKGIPVYVVDDDVYDHHPTLIIATADKFAGIAWREQAHKLFNLDLPNTPPPDLIIQDELHLISGPLGTLAGLYEAAIEIAASAAGPIPKIVASTATIRRASDQTLALFARRVRQFPPPATDARDSFFAVEAPRADKGTRLYGGVTSPGTSQTTLLVRAYARLLQSGLDVPGEDEARDPYWTLVGYFNSLRVLGGARMQVHNDVEDRLKQIAAQEQTPRDIDQVIELTSREPSSEIPGHLLQLGVPYPRADALDVVLATNMISVGVDIDRLGLMVVMGQPQGTSEYIQATSRVGRKFPGLVVVLLNSARSRDRSHYEAFVGYHGALYRQVESTSVTPFSPRARDRALHAVVVALARIMIPGLRANDRAADIGRYLPELAALRLQLLERVGVVSPVDVEAVAAQIDAIVERWTERAASVPRLKYWDDKKPAEALLNDAGSPGDEEAFPTLWSLRDVDRASNLFLLR